MKKIYLAFLIALTAGQIAQAQVLVNEICASSDTLAVGGQYSDWVEVYNAGSSSVNLKGYAISDKVKNPRKYVIDTDIEIYPGGHKLILCNGLNSGANSNFKLSAGGGESIVWSDPDGNIIDNIALPVTRKDFSYGRLSDGADAWVVFSESSPGNPNQPAKAMLPTPEFSVTPGFYQSAQNVEISCDDANATIYYTLDGTPPNSLSKKYTGAISIGRTQVLRAVAKLSGRADSETQSATYFIGERWIDLPVVSLITDRKNFYDNKIGIYVAGTNGIVGNCQDQPKNWNQPWERPVHIEYFDKGKKLQLSQDAGIKITGSCSRGNDMKSLRIIARKDYGDIRLRYKFFDKKNISEFKSIVLRNGGNDFGYTMFRDGLVTGLAGESMDIDVQAFQPAAVFLNGEYLGLHNIREKVSTHYIEENYGVDADMVDLLENDGFVNDGDNADYKALIDFVSNNSLSIQANYDKVAAQMDIDNFIDYWCAQIYIDNEDWPNNNIKFWRPQGANAKWRWIMFGAEFSCNIYGNGPDVNSIHHDIDPNTGRLGSSLWGGKLMRALLENDAFKAKFIQRMEYTANVTYRYDRVVEYADSLKALIQNEFPYLADRWNGWWRWGWDDRCYNLKEWFRNRPEYIRQHLKNYFGLTDPRQLTVTADTDGAVFSINGDPAGPSISGSFYGGLTMQISAQLPADRKLDYWEVKGKFAEKYTLFNYGDSWKYFNNGRQPSYDWQQASYSDSHWQEGEAPLGYSDSNTEATKLSYGPSSSNKYSACYFRKTVDIPCDPASISGAAIELIVDDGCVVYVNGVEAGRFLMPSGYVDYGTWASSYQADVNDIEPVTINIDPALLVKGSNVIAVEVHQCSSTSSDLRLNASMYYNKLGDAGTQILKTGTVSITMASEAEIILHTAAADAADQPARTEPVSGIFVNEVMTTNAGAVSDENGKFPAWIEIYNSNSQPVDLQELYILDAKTGYQLPKVSGGELTVPVHGHIVLFADGKPELGPLHLGIVLKPEKSNAVYIGELIGDKQNYIDWLEYPELDKNQSFGRTADGAESLARFKVSTPYDANSKGVIESEPDIFTVVDEVANQLESSFTLYPNPTQGIVTISGQAPDIHFTVHSLSGSLLIKGAGHQIDMSGLKGGVYIVRLQSGAFTKCIRLIKL